MKKFILVLTLMVFFMTGCSMMSNTPSDKVREFLDRYKNNDTVVINELNEYLDSENYDEDTSKKYREVYLRQYTNMKYDIKDETINGDKASVNVQVTVFDYFKTNVTSGDYFIANQNEFYDENGVIDSSKFTTYKINKLLDTTSTVDYTITINLTKVDGEWTVNDLTQDDLNKIHGIYEY